MIKSDRMKNISDHISRNTFAISAGSGAVKDIHSPVTG